MSDKHFGIVYRATSPSGKVYVGQTIKDLKCRQAAHFNNAKRCNKSHLFYNALRKYGEAMEWDIVATVHNRTYLDLYERFWILHYKSRGLSYNQTDGGDGARGLIHTPASRAKISAKNKGRKMPEEQKEKIRKAHTGKKNGAQSPEHRAKISAGNKGLKRTAEQRAKFVVAQANRVLSPEARGKISAANKGKVRSPEHSAKIGAAHKGKVISPEQREKQRVAMMGNTHRADWAKRNAAKAREYPLC